MKQRIIEIPDKCEGCLLCFIDYEEPKFRAGSCKIIDASFLDITIKNCKAVRVIVEEKE